jgi:hypothetical protein
MMLNLLESPRLHRRHLFAFAGSAIAIFAAFRPGGLVTTAHWEQTPGTVTSGNRVRLGSTLDADDWTDFDKSG